MASDKTSEKPSGRRMRAAKAPDASGQDDRDDTESAASLARRRREERLAKALRANLRRRKSGAAETDEPA